MAFPKVGNMAPAFTLQDQDGNKVSLKDFKGKKNVVLYFYPKAMTPGCTVQACGIRDSKKALAKADTVVLGVSPDPVARLGKFIEKQDLNFTLLSDEDHAVTEKYGAEAEMELLDSMSSERLAAAVDSRRGGKPASRGVWEDTKDAFDYWARRFRERLDAARQ